MTFRPQAAVALFTCACVVSMASVSSSNVGLVMTAGEVDIDGLRVPSNSAVFAGNRVSTQTSISTVQFTDGTNAVINPGTSLTVYRDHSVLNQGVTIQRGAEKHPVLADGLKVSGASSNAAIAVGVRDASHIEVSAQGGEANVWTPTGKLIARVDTGKILNFTITQAPASTKEDEVDICGKLRQDYLITDELGRVTYRLQPPPALDPEVGKRIHVKGTVPDGSPSPQLVTISDLRREKSCVAGAYLGPGAAPAMTGTAFNAGAIAFLVVVAAGGTLLGLGVAGAFGSSSQSPVTPAVP